MDTLTWVILIICVLVVLAALFTTIKVANGVKKWSKALEGEMEKLEKINKSLLEQTLGDSEPIKYDTTCPRGCPPFVCYAGGNDNCSYRSPSRQAAMNQGTI